MPAAVAGLAAFAATPIGGIVVNLAIGFAATEAESLIHNALAKPSTSKPIGTRLSVGTSGDDPQAFILGTYATAGTRCYRGVYGNDGDTPNAYYVDERVLSDVPLAALTGFWVGDSKCTILWGDDPVEQGYPVLEYRRDGKDYLWVRFNDGNQVTADAFLRARFGAHPTRPYTADMIGYGQASVIVTALADPKFFPSGEPDYKFETSGLALYNPAKDSTVGGAGTHRRDDPSTWEPSDLLPVQIYNVLMGIRYGDEWLFGLQQSTAYQLPVSSWIAAINAAGTAIALAAGGTEPQYAGGLEVQVSAYAADVIKELLKGCSGRMAEIGGIYKILVGAPGAAVYGYTDANVLVTREQAYTPFPQLEETHNGVQGSYPEPANGWAMKDAAGYYDAAIEAEDGNRRLAVDVTFNAVWSGTQVQRLERAMGLEARLFRQHTDVLPPEASELEPLDVVSKSSDRWGYTNKGFLVTAIDDEPTYQQSVSILETDPASFDWDKDTDEQAYSVGFLETSRPPPQPVTGWSAVPDAYYDATTRARIPSILAGVASGLVSIDYVRFQVRLKIDASMVFDGQSVYGDGQVATGGTYYYRIGGMLIGDTDYEVRGKLIPHNPARDMLWSNQDTDGTEGPWLTVHTPKVGLAPPDLGAELAAERAFFQQAIAALQNDMSLLAGVIEGQDLANYDDKRQVLADIAAKYQSSQASIKSVAEVAATANDAAAALATTLGASASGTTADLLVSNKVTAGEAGAEVTVGTYLSIDGGATHTEAFETMEVDATGKSVKTFVCKKIRATNPAGTYLLQFDLENGNSYEGSVA